MSRTMNFHKTCAITIISMILVSNYLQATEAAGFSTDLIHIDSLQSPSISPFQQVEAALQRSFNRAKTLIQYQSAATADLISEKGEYLMRIALGTPKVKYLAVADTGSDLTWVQCEPCPRCYKQRSPLFVANRSKTYKPVPCRSKICLSLPSTSCQGTNGTCGYSVKYGDGSFSRGDVATEKITLGANATAQIVIGCGHMNQGLFSPTTSGIVGLGGGKESLVNQLGPQFGGKFSYCLAADLFPGKKKKMKPSKIHFGDKAVVSGAGVVTTPIATRLSPNFYYLTLVGISVGNQKFELDYSTSSESSEKEEAGNIIIDSGSTLTILPGGMYKQVEAALKRQVSLKQIGDPTRQLGLCYAAVADADKKIPVITIHFKGADVKLKPYNTFMRTSAKSMCLAFAPSNISIPAIYGNFAQMNFLIGYDLVKKTLSFKPSNCSN